MLYTVDTFNRKYFEIFVRVKLLSIHDSQDFIAILISNCVAHIHIQFDNLKKLRRLKIIYA